MYLLNSNSTLLYCVRGRQFRQNCKGDRTDIWTFYILFFNVWANVRKFWCNLLLILVQLNTFTRARLFLGIESV